MEMQYARFWFLRGATESAEKFIVLFVFKGLSSSVECGWSFASSHVPRAPQALMRRQSRAGAAVPQGRPGFESQSAA
jgi:hypothetical protein